MQHIEDKKTQIKNSSNLEAVSSVSLEKNYQQIFEVICAETRIAIDANEMLAEFKVWQEAHPASLELASYRLESLYPPGRDSSKEQEEIIVAIIECRMFCSEQFDAAYRPHFDTVFRDLFIQNGVYHLREALSHYFTISSKYCIPDSVAIDSATTSGNFEVLARLYFSLYADPTETFSEYQIKFRLDRLPSGEWPNSVEQAVVFAISDSRMFKDNSFGFNDMPSLAREIISTAQEALDSYFEHRLGRSLGFFLRDVVYLTPEITEHADDIARRVYLSASHLKDPSAFLRYVIHESIHLAGKSDESFGIRGINLIKEGLIELLTIGVCEWSAQNGKELHPKYSKAYQDWANALEVLLVDHLFDGERKPLLDYYNSGDFNLFASSVSSALALKGAKAFSTQQVPYVRDASLVEAEIRKIAAAV